MEPDERSGEPRCLCLDCSGRYFTHGLLSLQEGETISPPHFSAGHVSCTRARRSSTRGEPLVSADATLQPSLFMSGCAKQSQTSLKKTFQDLICFGFLYEGWLGCHGAAELTQDVGLLGKIVLFTRSLTLSHHLKSQAATGSR